MGLSESYPAMIGLATASPPLYVTQQEAHEFYQHHEVMPIQQRALYERILLDGPIEGRFFGMHDAREVLSEDPDDLISRFAEHGRAMAVQASRTALSEAGVKASDVGGLVVNTCTGYLCPGLTSYVAEDLGLANDIKVVDLMGMGCGAAVPNLECGCNQLLRRRGRPVLCVAVEVCSATHFMGDDAGLTVSNCIFGDGAAAAVLGYNERPLIELHDFESGLFPKYREQLRYAHEGGRLRNQLSQRVPVIGASCVEQVANRLLERNKMKPSDIAWWAVHAGGTAVLNEVGKRFELSNGELDASREVFHKYGNMSSPTVLFALKALIKQNATAGPGLILAFGAGFTAFAALAHGKTQG